jgi:hypothetical protein
MFLFSALHKMASQRNFESTDDEIRGNNWGSVKFLPPSIHCFGRQKWEIPIFPFERSRWRGGRYGFYTPRVMPQRSVLMQCFRFRFILATPFNSVNCSQKRFKSHRAASAADASVFLPTGLSNARRAPRLTLLLLENARPIKL